MTCGIPAKLGKRIGFSLALTKQVVDNRRECNTEGGPNRGTGGKFFSLRKGGWLGGIPFDNIPGGYVMVMGYLVGTSRVGDDGPF